MSGQGQLRGKLGFLALCVCAALTGCPPPQTQIIYRDRPTPPPPTPEVKPEPPPPPKAPTATANVREISRVTDGQNPEFWPRTSPDGALLLFSVFDHSVFKDRTEVRHGEPLSVVCITPGKPGRKLIAGPYATDAAWYPDGKQFVYVYSKTEKRTLVRSPFGGLGMTFITPNPMGDQDSQPDVSPDGKKIAFHTRIGTATHVCTVNADGSNFTVYVEGCSPRWSPDGKTLAFDRQVGKTSHVFTLDLNAGQVTQVTTGSADNGFPVWSPDGKWLAFESDRDGKRHLYAMRPDGSKLTQLTKGGTKETQAHWSSDGFIYFACDAGAPKATPDEGWFCWTFSNIWRLKPALPEPEAEK